MADLTGPPGGLFDAIFTTDEMADATSERAWLNAMLEFEAGLAIAESKVGIIPAEAAAQIVWGCRSAELDPAAIGRAGRESGNPVVPLVRELRESLPAEAAGWVHFGATSQDTIDTALMLVMKKVLDLVWVDLQRAAEGAADLAEQHRSTPMVARTLLQQALPTTFGAKAAGWLVALVEARERILAVRDSRMAVQLGGAAGTLAALGDAGPEVVDALAGELGLAVPVVAWHTNRTRIDEIAGVLAGSSGAAAKVALDVSLLMQTEVGEVREPAHGGSSALPHKRNPAMSATVLACARRAAGSAALVLGGMAQEHERAVGAWQSEWQTMTELARAAGGAAAGVTAVLSGLEVLPDAMAHNLELTNGLVLTERVTAELARRIGYVEARRAVDAAARRTSESNESFRDSLAADAAVKDLLAALPSDVWDLAGWLGPAETVVDRALALYRL